MRPLSRHAAGVLVTLVAFSVACGSPAPATGSGQEARREAAAPTAPKRVLSSVTADLPTLRSQLNRAAGGILAGAPEIEQLVQSGLAIADNNAVLQPLLAEVVPSVENGLWRVFPDGRMETTWRIRDGALWQDGAPFTADDLVFTSRVFQDTDLPLLHVAAFDTVEKVEARDARTFSITWQKPYINADRVFAATGDVQPLPLPEHILAQPYQENKAGLSDLPYWSDEFVGTGPFKPGAWVRGSSITLEAFDRFTLGRPKIDAIEIKFIPDPTTLIANILSGAVEQPIGRGISFEPGLQLRDQWRDGHIEFSPGSDIKVWPQLLNPTPAVVADVRFRRAVYHAIDRQELADTLMAGQVEVAHTTIGSTDPEYPYVIDSVVKYPYDPRQTAQLVEALTYARGADGMFRDASGQPLVVELRSSPMDILRKTKLAIADYWQSAGIGVNVVDDSPQVRGNNEYRATFPAFDMSRAGSGAEQLETFISSQARTPQNRYVGQNGPNYMNPDFDALVETYLTTIPIADRMRAVAAVVHHMTDQVIVLDQFYDAAPTAVANRMVNVASKVARRGTNTWNAYEWDVK
ncbi:MAG TPA: ABC transporter substrate-binding protein [Chloroflexota bacterium]|nr:ABC transporter substrate-binding protein [Chloroflexota bacterium]